ncbi:hypothetical protein PV325_013688, partial [Microctonus aethiopoides]
SLRAHATHVLSPVMKNCNMETWLKPNMSDGLVHIDGNFFIHYDRKCCMGGGVACYISNSFKTTILSLSTNAILNKPEFIIFNSFEANCVRTMATSHALHILQFGPTHHTALTDSWLDIVLVNELEKIVLIEKSDSSFIAGHDL